MSAMTGGEHHVRRGELEKRTLADQVYERLRELIVNLYLPPGEKVDIKHLCQELGVSPIPVREALAKLVERGLLINKVGVGYFVVSLSRKDIRDIFSLRKQLELFALEELKRQPDSIGSQELLICRKTNLELLSEDNIPLEEFRARFDEVDRELHCNCIIKASGNTFLLAIYDTMYDFITIARHLSERLKEATEEHVQIIDALLNEDIGGAKNLLASHLDAFQTVLASGLPHSREANLIDWSSAVEKALQFKYWRGSL